MGCSEDADISRSAVGTDHFVATLRDQGIQLWTDGEELKVRAPRGSLSQPVKAEIVKRKAAILTMLRARSTVAVPELVVAFEERHQPFELTEMQEAYWLGQSDAFALGGVSAHAYWEYDFTDVDIENVKRAVQQLVARHDMLRSVVLDSGKQQILEKAPGAAMTVVDLRDTEPVARQATLMAARAEMSCKGPPTGQWPLFSLRAHLLPGSLTRFHVSGSLLILDGMSVQILARELVALYRDPDAALPPLVLSFRDYVHALIKFRDSAAYRKAKDYWIGRVADMPPAPELALTQAPSAVTGARAGRRRDHASWCEQARQSRHPCAVRYPPRPQKRRSPRHLP